MYWRDEWPTNVDGTDYDGKRLLELIQSGENPFSAVWDVNLLIREVQETLGAQVVDIPCVSHGSNSYGFHLKLSNRTSAVARLARGDVNWPNFDGFSIDRQISEVKFEADVYDLMLSQPDVKASKLLYHRTPKQHDGPKLGIPQDILGRRLMVFEGAKSGNGGVGSIWRRFSPETQPQVVAQAATIRAALFNYDMPSTFAEKWLRERLFEQKPRSIGVEVAPTRDFCVALFTSKIEATIRDLGDMIGWEDDHNVVGPRASAAKSSLLRFVPHMLPQEEAHGSGIYRLVLEHGDFGIHNMTITDDGEITSVFDWETGCIVPALLSDTQMCTLVDLGIDAEGRPAVTRVDRNADQEAIGQQKALTDRYHKALFDKAPDYQKAILAGLDARHLWFALRDWRGADPEEYFGELGDWADRRMEEIGESSSAT